MEEAQYHEDVFWDAAEMAEIDGRFGGAYRRHHQAPLKRK
jgi:hypothetical protein